MSERTCGECKHYRYVDVDGGICVVHTARVARLATGEECSQYEPGPNAVKQKPSGYPTTNHCPHCEALARELAELRAPRDGIRCCPECGTPVPCSNCEALTRDLEEAKARIEGLEQGSQAQAEVMTAAWIAAGEPEIDDGLDAADLAIEDAEAGTQEG